MLCELTNFPVIAFPSFLTCFCFYPGMNQGLRVLQGTLHGNGDEDRFSDVGDGIVGTFLSCLCVFLSSPRMCACIMRKKP
ncbi:hypothetical protein BJV77DRAFT_980098 [Russula vinacea]|nr:hypothetical protein BJV77DRAFT_980098 [Russula vinacea]